MEYPGRCTASVNQIRCENPVEGESDLCKTHRKRCRKLYLKYKNVCSKIPDFDYCDIDINSLNLQELNDLASDLKEQYILFQKCIQARDKHNFNCYILECRDQNHADFVQNVIDAMTQCDNTLSEIYGRIREEEQRLHSEQQQIREVTETLEDVEKEIETTEEIIERVAKRIPKLPTLEPINIGRSEEEMLEESIKKSQLEKFKETIDQRFVDNILDILDRRPELNRLKTYIGALTRMAILNPLPFAEETLAQLLQSSARKLWDFEKLLKAIPSEHRTSVIYFFTFTQSLYKIKEIKQLFMGVIDKEQIISESKPYINDLIKLQRRDEDAEKLNIIEEVKSCLKVLISKKELASDQIYDYLDINGSVDSPLLPLYRNVYFDPFIKADKDYLDLYLRLFFNKVGLSRLLNACKSRATPIPLSLSRLPP